MARNYIVLDCEGVDTVKRDDNSVHPETSLFYDLGFVVIDGNTGSILDSYSFINVDVYDNNDLMTSAYYAWKRKKYDVGRRIEWMEATTLEIWNMFKVICKRYNVRDVWAYNARYDMQCTNNTIRTMSNGFAHFFTPYGVMWRDVWDYAGSTLCNTRKYVNWCLTRGYTSDKGNPSTRAEIVYRYLINDDSFIEEHTALADAIIEASILLKCKRRKQKARRSIGQGWRDAAAILEQL